jgi:hypothetical protein
LRPARDQLINQRLVALLVVCLWSSASALADARASAQRLTLRRAGCLHVLSSFQRTEVPPGRQCPARPVSPTACAAFVRGTFQYYVAPRPLVKLFPATFPAARRRTSEPGRQGLAERNALDRGRHVDASFPMYGARQRLSSTTEGPVTPRAPGGSGGGPSAPRTDALRWPVRP